MRNGAKTETPNLPLFRPVSYPVGSLRTYCKSNGFVCTTFNGALPPPKITQFTVLTRPHRSNLNFSILSSKAASRCACRHSPKCVCRRTSQNTLAVTSHHMKYSGATPAFSHEAINLLECGGKRRATPFFLTFAGIANHLVLSRITPTWE